MTLDNLVDQILEEAERKPTLHTVEHINDKGRKYITYVGTHPPVHEMNQRKNIKDLIEEYCLESI
jgi:hypothetical protein